MKRDAAVSVHKRRFHVYNNMRPVFIEIGSKVTTETLRQNDILFDQLEKSYLNKGYKQAEKRRYSADILHAVRKAVYYNGCVVVVRNKNHPDYTPARLQVMDAWIKAGLLEEHRSPPGSPKMSRAVPTQKVIQKMDTDPWAFDPEKRTSYVILRNRATKEEKPFNPKDQTVAAYQENLELVNGVLSRYKITYQKWDEWEGDFLGLRRLRPIFYAIFSDDFKHHGRMYTGRYGHQGLRKLERRTILFNDMGCIELDYAGLHPRMLYHMEKIDYQDDPYALWDESTTKPQRLMAKHLINALINAESPEAAVAACNRAMSVYTKKGEKKRGKALEHARKLYDAWKVTGLKFGDIVPVAVKKHKRIAQHFGYDRGIQLMRMESSIALEVMTNFARDSVPCLGCHDSFVVPAYAQAELFRSMLTAYRERMEFLPIVK